MCGIISKIKNYDEDKVMEDCMDANADDFSIEEETVEFIGASTELHTMTNSLTEKGYTILSAEIEQVPDNYINLTDEEAIKKMTNLLEHLEEIIVVVVAAEPRHILDGVGIVAEEPAGQLQPLFADVIRQILLRLGLEQAA